jgi:hypothetical protein
VVVDVFAKHTKVSSAKFGYLACLCLFRASAAVNHEHHHHILNIVYHCSPLNFAVSSLFI